MIKLLKTWHDEHATFSRLLSVLEQQVNGFHAVGQDVGGQKRWRSQYRTILAKTQQDSLAGVGMTGIGNPPFRLGLSIGKTEMHAAIAHDDQSCGRITKCFLNAAIRPVF